jgi:predicted HTH domain antitoxin
MHITLPRDLEERLTAADAALALAIGLFADYQVTLGQGAIVAGLSQSAFLAALGKRKIPVHYEVKDALADVATSAAWAPR